MKKSALFAGLIVCLFVVSKTFAAGAEPRTPIPASIKKTAATFIISKSGSYYLAGNRLCDSNGIRVEANNVTIDLRGFSLTGNHNGSGIYMRNRINVEISNGTITDFNYAVNDDYVYMGQNNSTNHRVFGIRALSNTQGAIKFYAPNCQVRDCLITNNGSSASGGNINIIGISVGNNSTITGNTISDNGHSAQSNVLGISVGNNSIVTANTVYSNGYNALGVDVYGITTGLCSTITANIVTNNGYSANSVFGIQAGGEGCAVTGNTAYGNGSYAVVLSYGIYAAAGSTVTGNTVYQNGFGMSSGTDEGIYAGVGSTVIGNTVSSNGLSASGNVYGIYLVGHNFVNQNTAYNNGGTNMNDPGNCTFGQNHAP